MSTNLLAEISRFYGSNNDYVIAGGGNTSFKDGDILYIKGSGTSLAEASPEAFVKMDRRALEKIWGKNYPSSNDEREKAVLADLMAAKMPGEEAKRPSVETMLHDIIPSSYVVHLHPALVNGLTCSQGGEEKLHEIFDAGNFPEEHILSKLLPAIWIPSINPGYILSLEVKKALDEYKSNHNRNCQIIFLQNHGVFVGADSTDEIRQIYTGIITRLETVIKRRPDFSDERRDISDKIKEMEAGLLNTFGGLAFISNKEIKKYIESRESFYPVSSAFTPDHIVYAGSDPLFTSAKNREEFLEDYKNHSEKTGRTPKIIAFEGGGVFGAAGNEKAAKLALELFLDTVKVAVYTESFGGPLFMEKDKIDFINNWEVEAFRSRVAT